MGEPELKRMTADDLDAMIALPAIERRLSARDIFEGLPFAE